MKPDDYLRNAKVYVWKESFAVVKSKKPYPGAFANITAKNEITVIIDESKLDKIDVIELEKGWKMLTFDVVLPFGLVGFMAKISQALADEKISMLVISSYSTDHILVKEEYLEKAIKKLECLGCVVEGR